MESKVDERLGEVCMMKNGMCAKIIGYVTASEMTVQFENGVVRHGVSYTSFKKGTVACRVGGGKSQSNKTKGERVGDVVVLENGMKAVVIEYYNNLDCTVQFEDGTVVTGVEYSKFKKGRVRCPKGNKE